MFSNRRLHDITLITAGRGALPTTNSTIGSLGISFVFLTVRDGINVDSDKLSRHDEDKITQG